MEKKRLISFSVLCVAIFCVGMVTLHHGLKEFFFSKYYCQPVFFSAAPYIAAQQRAEKEISAPVGLSAAITGEENKILFRKNIDLQMPIASLTKLMTAWVVLEHYDIGSLIPVSLQAVQKTGDCGLKEGDSFPVEDFLKSILIESCNDSAFALAEAFQSVNSFVELMNSEAEKIGLGNTKFFNPSGLDMEDGSFSNYSTARDLLSFAKAIQENHPEIFNISRSEKAVIFGDHIALNQNRILDSGLVGGKTGWTPAASGSILLVFENEGGYCVHIVLGASSPEERFQEALKLVNKYSNK